MAARCLRASSTAASTRSMRAGAACSHHSWQAASRARWGNSPARMAYSRYSRAFWDKSDNSSSASSFLSFSKNDSTGTSRAPCTEKNVRSHSSCRAKKAGFCSISSAAPRLPPHSAAISRALSASACLASSSASSRSRGQGGMRTTRQRERTVGRMPVSPEAVRIKCVSPSGSSRDFSSAFCACTVMRWAFSSRITRRPSSAWKDSARSTSRR